MNLYLILNVSKTSSKEDIQKSYRRLVFQHAPDRNPGDQQAEEMFKRCTEAYQVLMDDEKRSIYDKTGKVPQGNRGVIEQPTLVEVLSQALMATVSKAINDKLDLGLVNVVQAVKDTLTKARKELQQGIDKNTRIFNEIRGISTKVKNDSQNVFSSVVKQQEVECNNANARLTAEIVKIDMAIQYLSNLGYDAPKSTKAGTMTLDELLKHMNF